MQSYGPKSETVIENNKQENDKIEEVKDVAC